MTNAPPDQSNHSELAAPDPNRWRALVVIAMAQLMVVLDASIVNIANTACRRISASAMQTVNGS